MHIKVTRTSWFEMTQIVWPVYIRRLSVKFADKVQLWADYSHNTSETFQLHGACTSNFFFYFLFCTHFSLLRKYTRSALQSSYKYSIIASLNPSHLFIISMDTDIPFLVCEVSFDRCNGVFVFGFFFLQFCCVLGTVSLLLNTDIIKYIKKETKSLNHIFQK